MIYQGPYQEIMATTLFVISLILGVYSVIVFRYTTRVEIWNSTPRKWFQTLMFTAPMSIVLFYSSLVFFIPTILKLLGEK